MIAPVFHGVVWIFYEQNNFVLATVAPIVSLVWAWFIFGIDCIRYPHSAEQLRLQRKLDRRRELGLATLEDDEILIPDWGAMFAATGTTESTQRLTFIAKKRESMQSTSALSLNTFFGKNDDIDSTKQNNSSMSHLDRSVSDSLKSYSQLTQYNLIQFVDYIFSKKNFWFLPKYWDKEFTEKYGVLSPSANRMHMWFAGGLFLTVYSADYVFLIFFTAYFRSGTLTDLQRLFLFGFYIFVTTLFRMMLKTLGMYLDRYKNPSCSMFFVGEFLGLMFYFYYTFYCVLFESIRSVPEFLGL